MKTNSKHLAIAVLSMATIFAACEKQDIRPRPINIADQAETAQPAERKNAPDQNNFERTLCNSKWVISNFEDGEVAMKTNNTDMFRDYVFEFTPNDVVIARGSKRSVTGKWNTITVDGRKRLVMSFGFKPFVRLNSHWTISDYSAKAVYAGHQNNERDAVLNLQAVSSMPM
ncbi:MAG TPA: hypothetical protein VF868_00365 [Bacteroidia bacterium]|jgi:hypothetical protein